MDKYSKNLLVASGKYDSSKEYWLNKLKGDGITSNFPSDIQVSENIENTCNGEIVKLDDKTCKRLYAMCNGSDYGMYMILLSGVTHMLFRLTGNVNILEGMPVFKQNNSDNPVNEILPFFINIHREWTFKELLVAVKQTISEANQHQSFPVDMLEKEINSQMDDCNISKFNTVVMLDGIHVQDSSDCSFADALFVFKKSGEGMNLTLKYNSCKYSQTLIEQILKLLSYFFDTVAKNPDALLMEIGLPEEQERKILFDFNGTTSEFPHDKTIYQLFEEQLDKTPQNTALVYKNLSCTYEELNAKASQLAGYLQSIDIKSGNIVGIMVERSIEMIVGIYGILKAGAAYLPIDPEYPEDRIRYMLEDSGATVLLVDGKKDINAFDGMAVINLKDSSYEGYSYNTAITSNPDDLAYVIYTSGSTGKPKGVAVNQLSAVNLLTALQKDYPLEEKDAYLLKTSYCFDVSVAELFGWFHCGGRLVILEQGAEKEPKKILNAIIENNVTHMNFVPSMFNLFLNIVSADDLGKAISLKHIFVAGEAIVKDTVENFYEMNTRIKLWNLYGPTEATVYATQYPLECFKEGINVPIGKPLKNTKAYIVNKLNMLQPIGVEGELCIAGTGLARGYLNRPELTAEKFVSNPFAQAEDSSVMYKTGDLVRWLPDGNIEFLGRIDHQVKIRGFRIEIGEIENAILSKEAVKEAVVVAKDDKNAGKYLCAYVTADEKIITADMRNYLLQTLPDYMVPSYFIQLAKLPLNFNGKIDRKALPEPNGSIDTGVEYVAPRNENEKKLLEICSQILGIEKIGMKDNFFELGGHSLKAATLIARIYKEFNAELQFGKVFATKSISELAEYLESAKQNTSAPIEPVDEMEYYPVSSAQKRLFVLNQIEGDGINYNISLAMKITGNLDKQRLENAFKDLIQRHETLRTSFRIEDGEPVQVVHENVDFKLDCIGVSEEQVRERMKDFIAPFKLSEAPLLRAILLESNTDEHVLIIDMHHIVTDGVSIEIISRELFTLYNEGTLSDLKIQYKDFSQWQNKLQMSDEMKEKEQYWLDVFKGEIPVLNMPADFSRPTIQSFEGSRYSCKLSTDTVQGLRKLTAETGTTLFMVLNAAFNVLLNKYSGQEDIVIGSPAAGRMHTELEGLVGMFVNTLVIRNYVPQDKTFTAFLEEVKSNALKAFDNQEYQFEDLVEKLQIPKDISRNPLFDVMFVLQNIEVQEMKTEELSFVPLTFHNGVSKFDLTLEAVENGNEITFNFEYCTSLFNRDTIVRFAEHYLNILAEVIGNPQIKVSDIDMLSEAEKQQLLVDFNNTVAEYPKDKVIHQLIEEQAIKTPDSISVIFKDESITYRELNIRANQLARLLRKNNIGRNSIVALMAERSIEMSVAMLAVLKAGGAYLPVSPEYPADRVSYILEDSGAKVLLIGNDKFDSDKWKNVTVINLKEESLNLEEVSNLDIINEPSDLAYVIYTSGSTGKPKGVMIEHYSLINRLNWMQKKYPIGEEDIILQKTPYTFDVSVWELFWWSLVGARLCHLVPGGEKDPGTIVEAIEKYGITTMHFVPSMLSVFLEYIDENQALDKLSSLRQVFASGEALNLKQVEKFNRLLNAKYGTTLNNLYGPTEAAIDVSYFDCSTGEEFDIIPIGKPIDNINLYILDKSNRLLPIGVPGELHIAGDGLARGYLNKPDLTKEKFVPNPFASHSNYKLMYKTGDLARWMADGNIEYMGRLDFQVKIRGNRIELGEIEAELLKHENINEALVIAKEDKDGNKYLCAYIVSDLELTVSVLRDHLIKNLPEYMIPSYFIRLEHMPLSSNGKADRKALPEPDGKINSGEEYEPPRNETEQKLVEVWQEVLSLDNIGINGKFFNLGGDSIKAISLVSKMNNALGSNLQIKDLYLKQSIKELAEIVSVNSTSGLESDLTKGLEIIENIKLGIQEDKLLSEKLQQSAEDFYPLSPIQQGIVFFAKFLPDEPIYHDQFTYMVKFEMFDIDLFNIALTSLMEKHPILRTTFDLDQFNVPMQIVHKSFSSSVGYDDISDTIKEEQEEHILRYLQNDLKNKFKFDNEFLWRMRVFRISNNGYCIALSFQHAILDGWSVAALGNELVDTYMRTVSGEANQLQKLKNSYKDYVAINLSRKASSSAKEFWKEYLKDYNRLKLPFNISNKKIDNTNGIKILRRDLGSELMKALEKKAKSSGYTVNELCLSAHIYLLSIITTDKDIVTGVVTHDRPAIEDSEKILGCFLNTIPIRIKLDKAVKKEELLKETQQSLFSIKANELFLSDISNAIGDSNNSGNPIFDVLFNFTNFHVLKGMENTGIIDEDDDGLIIEPSEMTNTLFDLEVSKTLDKFNMQIKYSPNYFHDVDIETASELYVKILEELAKEDVEYLKTEEFIAPDMKQKAIFEFNNTNIPYAKEKTMHQLFEEQVERTPDNIALSFKDKKLTYRELNEKANQLARLLIDKGVKSGDHVALVMGRSLEMIVGMFAILKCGGAYVPIDPDYPQTRKEYITSNSKVSAVLADNRYDMNNDNIIIIDSNEFETYPADNLNIKKDSRDLAYVIYTSGSTGLPKGVMIEHHSAVNLISWVNREFNVNENDSILFITSMCFDLSVYDIFGTLAAGGRVVIALKDQIQNPLELKELLVAEKITFWDSVPSTMNYLVNFLEDNNDIYTSDYLRLVFMSGDWIPVKLPDRLRKYFPNAKPISLGGATEGTVWSIYYPIEKVTEHQTSIPYGKPMDNNYFYILDENLSLVPQGVAGELFIGGVGVARGYMNDEARTSASFVKNRFLDGENDMMYKTGDLGRMLPDGNIEFLGRKDHQVKIRGFRVELGEIENQLLKHTLVKETVVVDRMDTGGNKYLCAYIVWDGEQDVTQLKDHLAGCLPEYMIPTYFITIDSVPLTGNGKIDRKSLPEPAESIVSGAEYQAPTNEVEEKLLKIWEELLEVKNIGINDNFFDVGGNSLLLVRMHSQINKLYPDKISVTDLFRIPTIKKISEFIGEGENDDKEVEVSFLTLPDGYFSEGNFGNQTATYDFSVEESLYEKLKMVSLSEKLDMSQILLSMYVYLFAEVTEQDLIAVQTMLEKENMAVSLEADVSSVESISELMHLVGEKHETQKDINSYRVLRIESRILSKEKAAVAPLFYNKDLYTLKNDLLDLYDLILSYRINEDGISFRFEYGRNLNKEMMENLINGYSSLLNMLVEKY